jgi:hypothetical protein
MTSKTVRIPNRFSCGNVSTGRVYEDCEIGDGMTGCKPAPELAHYSSPGAVLKRSE